MNKEHGKLVAEICGQLANCGENLDTFAEISVGNFDINIQVHYGIQYAQDGAGEYFTPVLYGSGWCGDYENNADSFYPEEKPRNGYVCRELASPDENGVWNADPELIKQFAKDCVRNAIQCGI